MKAQQPNNFMPTVQRRCSIVGRLLLTTMLFVTFCGGTVNAQTYESVYGDDATSTTYFYSPYGGYYGYEYYVYLYDAADVDFSGNVIAVSFKSKGATEADGTANYKLWMKDVPNGTTLDKNTTFDTYIDGSTPVFVSNTMPALADGWNTTNLNTSFSHQQGNSILVMAKGVACSPSGGCEKVVYYKDSKEHVWYKRVDNSDPGTSVTGSFWSYLPSIKFTCNVDANFCPTPSGLTISNRSETSITMSWTSQESNFTLEYKTATATTWTAINNISAKSYALTGLSPTTTYNVRVKAKRGTAESAWLEGSFTTTSLPTVVGNGWSDNFEGTSCDWELVNGTLTNKWVWGTATKNGGSKALYISNDGGTTNAYTSSSSAMVYATKLLSFTEGKYVFSYNWKAEGESTYDYLRVALVPTSVVLTAGSSTPSGFSKETLPSGWIALDGGRKLNLVDAWQLKDVIVNVPTGNYYLVFAWRNDYATGYNPPAAIDDVSVTQITCQSEVTNMVLTNLTSNSAALTWTATGDATQWQVAYSANANFESATLKTATAATYEITGLQPNFHYYARVRACCSGSDYGMWSDVIQFTTDCAVITTYPYSENFDSNTISSGFLPNCWRRINTNTTYYDYYPYVINNNANSTSNCLLFYSYAYFYQGTTTYDPQDQYAILPRMENLGGKLIKFYAKGYNAKSTFKIGVMTDPTDVSTFTEIDPKQALTTTYEEFAVIIPEQAQGTYVAFMIEGASEERNTNCVYIDDIVIDVAPTCTKPAGLKCTVTTVNSATLDWTENGNATEWQICIDGDETHLVSANSNPFSVTGLNAGTAYTAKVRSVKGNEHSEWSKEVSFATKCEAITHFPWSENFDGYSYGDFEALCWVNEHVSGSGTYIFKVNTASTGANNTPQLQLPDMSAGTLTKLVLPEMMLPNANYQFVLDVYRDQSYFSYEPTEGIRVYASSDGNITGATELAFIPRDYRATGTNTNAETAEGWYTYELSIPMSGTCYIILQGESQYCKSTKMDNFVVRENNNFPKPTGLTFDDIASNSVTLSWTENGNATAWQICMDNDENNLFAATSNPFTINGLTPSTAYTVKVRACGENVHSEWSKAVSFQTNCGTTTLPYYCGFENAGDLECWTKSDCHQYTGINSSAHHSGNNAFKFYFTNDPPQYLISPELDGTSDITVAFYYKLQSTPWIETFQVGYSSATTNPKDFVWGNEITARNVDNWELYEEVFPEGTKYVAIKCTSNNQYYLFIDDFSVVANDDDKEYSITTDGVVEVYSNHKVITKACRGQLVTLSWDGSTVPAGQYVTGFNINKAHGGTVTATPNEENLDYTFVMPGDNVIVQTITAPQEECVIDLTAQGAVQVVSETLAGMLTQCEGYVNNTIDFDGNGNADVQLTKPTADKNSTDPYANDFTVRRLAGADDVPVNYSFNFVYPFPYRYNRVLFKLGKESTISNITLSASTGNEYELNEYNGQTANVTIMSGILYKDGYWNTLCLPFDVTISGSVLNGDGVQARELTSASISGTTLTLNFNDPTNAPVTKLSAGVPYIIKWTKPNGYVAYNGGDPSTAYDIVDPKFIGVRINKQLAPYDNKVAGDGRVRFIGIYEPIQFKTKDKSILFLGIGNTLYYPNPVYNNPVNQEGYWSYPSINAFRAYFKIGEDDTNEARAITSFVINLGNEQDGINEVVELYGVDDSRWYDLNGRQLNGQPSQPGVYLNNHRKVVIK